jgi:GT2 family glycosyltransferase
VKLSVVILNWNAATDTIQCIERIGSWQQIEPQIWVVDNASHDGSADMLARCCPQVHLIRNPVNQGFAGGTNRGLIAASAASAAPVLLLNNDAQVAEVALLQLGATLAADPSVGIVGSLLYQTTQPERLIAAGCKNPVLHIHNLNRTVPEQMPVFPVDYISGSVALVRASLFKTIGLLDETYFFYTEVADFCRRARQHGYRTVVNSRARAYHDLKRSSPLRSTLYTYYLIRNRFLYLRKFYRLARWPLTVFWALYSWALAAKLQVSGQPAAARAVWLGVNDGLLGRFGGQNERVLAACAIQRSHP